MKKIKYLLPIVIAAILALPCMAAGPESAASIMGGLKKNIAEQPSVEAVFTIKSDNTPLQGSIIMSESKFTMKTPQLAVWYDGKTQWTLVEASKEVSISEPTADELMLTNPFAILTSYDGYYTARRLPDLKGRRRVQLVPKGHSTGIENIVVTIDAATHYPTAIVITFDDKQQLDVTIDKISGGNKKADAAFVFDIKKYPGFEINDLR